MRRVDKLLLSTPDGGDGWVEGPRDDWSLEGERRAGGVFDASNRSLIELGREDLG